MKALFLINSAHGHLHRSFPVAKKLQKQGYEIIYGHTGNFEIAQILERQEFSLKLLRTVPFGAAVDEYLMGANFTSYFDTLFDKLTNRTFFKRSEELDSVVSEISPSIIVIDTFLSTDFIALYPLFQNGDFKIVFLQTMLSTYDDGATPPLNSIAIPGKLPYENIRSVWRNYYLKRWFQDAVERFKYFGMSRMKCVRIAFKFNKIPEKYAIIEKKIFHVGFDNIPEWIAAPRGFEFPERRLLSFQSYIGMSVDLNRVEDVSPDYKTIIRCILSEKVHNADLKIIYISFGTVQKPDKFDAEPIFFKRIAEIAKSNPNWKFIHSVRPEAKKVFTDNNANIYTIRRVPQIDLLRHTDLFITHGGINSIMEAIVSIVPMLVYPISYNWDLPGNAARVEKHGLGLIGRLKEESLLETLHNIDRLLKDDMFKVNLKKMNEKMLNEREAV